ncbi:uncharacterized protein LTR77_002954 [Saxophila tyrrhenica]|uniref:Uncharacterized protein n=1 Tax=Saxophila tyrrhenica TaxID=1690608 RepID=A0AAV9PIU6_9PEZI|nr:hypothetical protein LTR77_002954 [Saxophila tyrrhenica]
MSSTPSSQSTSGSSNWTGTVTTGTPLSSAKTKRKRPAVQRTSTIAAPKTPSAQTSSYPRTGYETPSSSSPSDNARTNAGQKPKRIKRSPAAKEQAHQRRRAKQILDLAETHQLKDAAARLCITHHEALKRFLHALVIFSEKRGCTIVEVAEEVQRKRVANGFEACIDPEVVRWFEWSLGRGDE